MTETPAGQSNDEQSLWTDLADGRLDEHSWLQAALIAGGDYAQGSIDESPRDGASTLPANARAERVALGEFAAAWQSLLAGTRGSGQADRPLAAELLEDLHLRLRDWQYDAGTSDLALALRTRRYNCLVATLLYLHLAQQHQLVADAVVAPGHIWARVQGAQGPVGVETTVASGYGSVMVAEGRVLSAAGVVAIVYYNRAIDELTAGDWRSAIEHNRQALRLDSGNAPARENLRAAACQGSEALLAAGQFADASVLWAAIESEGDNDEVVDRQFDRVRWHWARALSDERRFEDAMAVVHATNWKMLTDATWRTPRATHAWDSFREPSGRVARRLSRLVHRAWAAELFSRGDFVTGLWHLALAGEAKSSRGAG